MLEILNSMDKETLSACMAIAATSVGSLSALFGYYNRRYLKVDIWGYTVVNSIIITTLLTISCFIINPKLKLTIPDNVIPTLIAACVLTVIAILFKIIAVTNTSNISYTNTYKIIGNIIVFLGSAYVLKENFTLRGVAGILLGLVGAYLIFEEQLKK